MKSLFFLLVLLATASMTFAGSIPVKPSTKLQTTASETAALTPKIAQIPVHAQLQELPSEPLLQETATPTHATKEGKTEPRHPKTRLERSRIANWFSGRVFAANPFKRQKTHTGSQRHPDLLAILALSFGIAGLIFGFGIAAIVLGHMALRRGERRAFAIAGLVMGYLKLLFWVAYLGIFILFIVLFW